MGEKKMNTHGIYLVDWWSLHSLPVFNGNTHIFINALSKHKWHDEQIAVSFIFKSGMELYTFVNKMEVEWMKAFPSQPDAFFPEHWGCFLYQGSRL